MSYNREYYQKNKARINEKNRNNDLLRKYGISQNDWDALFESQGRACAICKTQSVTKWHTDHCHSTGSVRGILCRDCNLLLGAARDNTTIIADGIDYLQAFKCAA